MNLSKILKQKRDAEARLARNSPTPNYIGSGGTPTTGGGTIPNDSFVDVSGFATKKELDSKSDTDHTHEIVDLTDVDIIYTGNAGKFLKINTTEDGIDTGEATGGGASAFTDLSDSPADYTGQAGKVPTVKATEDGLEFSNAPAATNGLPTGGTAGQILSKIDETNYNAEWVDAPSGAGTPEGTGRTDRPSGTWEQSIGTFNNIFQFVEIKDTFWIDKIKYTMTGASTAKIIIRSWGGNVLGRTEEKIVGASGVVEFNMEAPVLLRENDYIVFELVTATALKSTRQSSTLYNGTLYKVKGLKTADFLATTTFSETLDFELVEYNTEYNTV